MPDTKTNILVVDDYPDNIRALSGLIAADDVEIHAAESGDRALELLTQYEFGLAILDVQMPVMTGFELARLIRGVRKYRNLPIIFVTAEPETGTTVFEGYQSGAIDLLFKPLNPHVVRSKVRAFVDLDRQSRLLEAQVTELNRLRLVAEVASMAKSQFLANMSHEIRTPLAAVLGYSDLLTKEDVSPEDRKEFADSIARNGQLLLRLIDDILDFSRIEANRLQLENINFDLKDILDEVNATLTFKAQEKGITLDFSDVIDHCRYLADPIRIKQSLLNIIGNAIKFTPDGTVHVSIEIAKASNNDDTVRFIVQDPGLGMTREQVEKLFQPFGQGDASTKRKFGGSGLGLVIAREIAKAYQGDVRVLHSEPGKGSTFELTMTLPKATGAMEHVPSSPLATDDGRSKMPTFEGHTALVVDDSFDNLKLIEFFLKNTHLKMTFAENGEQAIQSVMKNKYDVILLDVQMPDMDGYQVTRTLRAKGVETPIIAVTAHALKEDHDACLAAGYNSVLVKPLDRTKLVQHIGEYLT